MGLKTTVTILKATTTYNSARIPTQVWSSAGTLRGTLLPDGGDIKQEDYGIEDKLVFKFYTKDTDSDLVINNKLQTDKGTFFITHINDYGKVREVFLRDDVNG